MRWLLFTGCLPLLTKNSDDGNDTGFGDDMIETYRGVVYPWQCDHMGHMNVQFYAEKFDEATWQLFAAICMTSEYLRGANRGMVAVEQKTRYRAEVVAGDVIEIRSSIREIKGKSIRYSHIMMKSGSHEVAAETEFVGVHIDTVTRKSCEFEEQIYRSAARMIETGGSPVNDMIAV
jgi:acyl-CoA thioester hydrolase